VADKGSSLALGIVLSAFSAGTGVVVPPPAAEPEPAVHPGRPLAEHLARHYRIGAPFAAQTMASAYLAAQENGLDPLLVLAVIGIESSFNPAAESGMGAKGLMQIIPRWHGALLDEHGGEELVLQPAVNIAVGTRILNEYIRGTGSIEAGLQRYNGASWDDTARYAQKVLDERSRLERALLARAGP